MEATEMRTLRTFGGYIRLAKNINTGIHEKLVVSNRVEEVITHRGRRGDHVNSMDENRWPRVA
jgi:hypothetical protein